MKTTMTVVIKKWLLKRINNGEMLVKSSDIETHLPYYGETFWSKKHTPSTWSRNWRQFREDKEYLNIDIKSIEPIQTKSKQTTWEIKRI